MNVVAAGRELTRAFKLDPAESADLDAFLQKGDEVALGRLLSVKRQLGEEFLSPSAVLQETPALVARCQTVLRGFLSEQWLLTWTLRCNAPPQWVFAIHERIAVARGLPPPTFQQAPKLAALHDLFKTLGTDPVALAEAFRALGSPYSVALSLGEKTDAIGGTEMRFAVRFLSVVVILSKPLDLPDELTVHAFDDEAAARAFVAGLPPLSTQPPDYTPIEWARKGVKLRYSVGRPRAEWTFEVLDASGDLTLRVSKGKDASFDVRFSAQALAKSTTFAALTAGEQGLETKVPTFLLAHSMFDQLDDEVTLEWQSELTGPDTFEKQRARPTDTWQVVLKGGLKTIRVSRARGKQADITYFPDASWPLIIQAGADQTVLDLLEIDLTNATGEVVKRVAERPPAVSPALIASLTRLAATPPKEWQEPAQLDGTAVPEALRYFGNVAWPNDATFCNEETDQPWVWLLELGGISEFDGHEFGLDWDGPLGCLGVADGGNYFLVAKLDEDLPDPLVHLIDHDDPGQTLGSGTRLSKLLETLRRED